MTLANFLMLPSLARIHRRCAVAGTRDARKNRSPYGARFELVSMAEPLEADRSPAESGLRLVVDPQAHGGIGTQPAPAANT